MPVLQPALEPCAVRFSLHKVEVSPHTGLVPLFLHTWRQKKNEICFRDVRKQKVRHVTNPDVNARIARFGARVTHASRIGYRSDKARNGCCPGPHEGIVVSVKARFAFDRQDLDLRDANTNVIRRGDVQGGEDDQECKECSK